MEIIINRIKQTDYQTKGNLFLYDKDSNNMKSNLGYTDWSQTNLVSLADSLLFSCKTLELPWLDNQTDISCIPEDVYTAMPHISPTFGESIWIREVPDRSEILIHFGNYAGSTNPNTGRPDTRGCILVGEEFYDIDGDGHLDVTNSKNTMKELYNTIKEEEKIKIRIINTSK